MAQTGYTPIQLYNSTTTGNSPAAVDLIAGELALNSADGVLFYKDTSGVVQVLATKKLLYAINTASLIPTAPPATTNFNVSAGTIAYYTANATANFTLNIQSAPAFPLDGALAIGQSVTVELFVTNGATPYYPNVIQIGGSAISILWQGGTAPTGGNANSVDKYTFTIIKTASATFKVFATQTKFA